MAKNVLYKGDCLIESDKIESGSVDLILTDLPYGTVKGLGENIPKYDRLNKAEWDVIIPTKKIMQVANRILRKNGKMILFSQQPFTTELINNAIPNIPFSYTMFWDKEHFANCLLANKACVNYMEEMLLFSKTYETEAIHPLRPYFKIVIDFIGLNLKQINTKLGHRRAEHTFYIDSTQYGLCTEKTYSELIEVFGIDKMQGFKKFTELKQIDDKFKNEFASIFNLWEGNKYKSNILKYKKDYNGYHPTQKPIKLLEKIFEKINAPNFLFDPYLGSGSTMVAAHQLKRRCYGMELEPKYCQVIIDRMRKLDSSLIIKRNGVELKTAQ
jgi:site-specific DNA-methyltransferase (adenine-specific)